MTSILNKTSDCNIIWIEDTGTIPFQSLASRLTEEQISQIQYTRVFELEGYIETLKELDHKQHYTIILSNLGSMSQRRAYVDNTRANCLVSDLMVELRRLGQYKCDSYVDGVEGMVGYFIDEVLTL